MKKIYFIFLLLISVYTNAQIINIPDANFKAKLLASDVTNNIASIGGGSTYIKIDSNDNGEIEISEVQSITGLNVSSSNITQIDGIEYFLNLRNLNISNNNLNGFDLSNNSALFSLDFSFNNLQDVNLTFNSNLKYLTCNNNNLIELDLSYNRLNYLVCNNNNLEFLNVKNGSNISMFLLAFEFDNNPNLQYVCTDTNAITNTVQLVNSYGYTNCNVGDYCNFVPSGNHNIIQGNSKFDLNNNGCDVSDIDYSNLKISITDGAITGSFIANSTGGYYMPVPAGNHTITPFLENPTYFNISPASFTVIFPTQASPFTQDFCVTANGLHSDVEVVVIPTLPARPGFDTHYRIIYKNIGNQVENGEVKFAYEEDVLDFVSSSLITNSQNTLANTTTLSWNYSNLMPFETRTIDVVLNLNSPMETPAVNIGDVLGIFSEISTTNSDEDLSNNSSGLRQVVVGSYDPNVKTCIEGVTVDISMVGEYVHYVIRFENTGTYPAENIVVKDMIEISKFDISTLVSIHGSHEFYTRINGNKVEFIFENINLDFNDAMNDGYVAFKIKTLPTLSLGDTFSNEANIYFDYNFPITTNEYVTTIQNLLSNQDFSFDKEFVLYPNPAKNILNISTKNQNEIQSVEIYNLVGQVVIAIPNSTKAIDVSSLETGTYFIKLNTEKGSTTTKFVKK